MNLRARFAVQRHADFDEIASDRAHDRTRVPGFEFSGPGTRAHAGLLEGQLRLA